MSNEHKDSSAYTEASCNESRIDLFCTEWKSNSGWWSWLANKASVCLYKMLVGMVEIMENHHIVSVWSSPTVLFADLDTNSFQSNTEVGNSHRQGIEDSDANIDNGKTQYDHHWRVVKRRMQIDHLHDMTLNTAIDLRSLIAVTLYEGIGTHQRSLSASESHQTDWGTIVANNEWMTHHIDTNGI